MWLVFLSLLYQLGIFYLIFRLFRFVRFIIFFLYTQFITRIYLIVHHFSIYYYFSNMISFEINRRI